MLALLVGAWRSRRRTADRPEIARAAELLLPAPDDLLRVPWPRALILAVSIGVIGGALFSLRMGGGHAPAFPDHDARRPSVCALSMLGAAVFAAPALAYLLFPGSIGAATTSTTPSTSPGATSRCWPLLFRAAAALAVRDLRALRASKPG